MGVPVKLKQDGFIHLGEEFNKGDIFDAPHEAFASFMCEQEHIATRVNEEDCAPEKVGTMKRTLKKSAYNTKVMEPAPADAEPVKTKSKARNPTAAPKAAVPKSNVKAKSDTASEST